jgi:hypothetical protein
MYIKLFQGGKRRGKCRRTKGSPIRKIHDTGGGSFIQISVMDVFFHQPKHEFGKLSGGRFSL